MLKIETMHPESGRFKVLEHQIMIDNEDAQDKRNVYGHIDDPDGEVFLLEGNRFMIVAKKHIIEDDDLLERITRAFHIPPAGSDNVVLKQTRSIELTNDEHEVLSNYVFRKLCKLKDAGLEDSKCYIELMSVYQKLKKARKEDE